MGAHTEPWMFPVVSDLDTKSRIWEIVKEGVEKSAEEEVNYRRWMAEKWVKNWKQFSLNWKKPYLVEAPYLILVFKRVNILF